MIINCLGASGEVGRSAFLVETDKKILLDYGIKIFGRDEMPEYPLTLPVSPDAAIISHAHMDHSGYLPNLYVNSHTKWYATRATREIAEVLIKDSMKILGERCPFDTGHFNKAMGSWAEVNYGKDLYIGKTRASFSDAGHIAGAAIVELEYQKKRLVYTGDFKMEPTRLHRGAKPIEDVDILIIEGTYGLKEHPNRKDSERQLMDEIEETIDNEGTALLPAFALGRTQELIRTIRAHNKDVPIHLDGMGKGLTEIYMKNKGYIEDPRGFRQDVKSVDMVYGFYAKKEAVRQPGVIITSAGMMQGGPVLGYLVTANKNSRIIFTGYNVEGTNGWKLLNKGFITINDNDLEVDLPSQYIDLSAHAGRTDLLNFIKHANPQKIVVVHSDHAKEFQTELVENFGYDAVAPSIGDKIEV
ncbi:MAG: MBL fold metallo-hydrolase [Candidatus Micrarchaeota archaeon]